MGIPTAILDPKRWLLTAYACEGMAGLGHLRGAGESCHTTQRLNRSGVKQMPRVAVYVG